MTLTVVWTGVRVRAQGASGQWLVPQEARVVGIRESRRVEELSVLALGVAVRRRDRSDVRINLGRDVRLVGASWVRGHQEVDGRLDGCAIARRVPIVRGGISVFE